jgi:hypothetical protein
MNFSHNGIGHMMPQAASLAEAVGLLVGEPDWSWNAVEKQAANIASFGTGSALDAWLRSSAESREMHIQFIARALMV